MKILLSLLLLATVTHAQTFKPTPKQTATLRYQATDCANALLHQNYIQLAYYTYPPIIQAMGGQDKMVQKLTETLGEMQSHGAAFKAITIGDVKQITRSGGDLYSVVQDIIQLSFNGTVVTRSSFLLAISHNNGRRWYFVDTAPLKNQNLKKMFPTYPPGLVIPDVQRSIGGN
jgi:hypothetical protein